MPRDRDVTNQFWREAFFRTLPATISAHSNTVDPDLIVNRAMEIADSVFEKLEEETDKKAKKKDKDKPFSFGKAG